MTSREMSQLFFLLFFSVWFFENIKKRKKCLKNGFLMFGFISYEKYKNIKILNIIKIN